MLYQLSYLANRLQVDQKWIKETPMSEFPEQFRTRDAIFSPTFAPKTLPKRPGFSVASNFLSKSRPLKTPDVLRVLVKWIKSGSKNREAAIAHMAASSWHVFVGEIDWLVNSSEYIRATDVLIGIRETVLATRRVTDGQRRAVESIRDTYGAA